MSSDPHTFLTTSDKRTIALWVLAAVIGLVIIFKYHDAAFPSTSIDFQLTRLEAEALARDVMTTQGHRHTGYQAVTTFGFDDLAKIYLEREVGLEAANRIMASEVNVWQWNTRFFRPEEQEEFFVLISPAGRLVGFYHEIEETRPGPVLPEREAREIAELFLRNTQSIDIANYRLVESNTDVLDFRADHTFTWERDGYKAKDATVRLMVTIQGNRVGGYSEYLKIPEVWQRDYERIRSRNSATQAVAQIGWAVIIIIILILFIKAISQNQFTRSTWRFGVLSGVVIGVTSVALAINLLPLSLTSYATTDSLQSFYIQLLLSTFISAGFLIMFITLAGAVGTVSYRSLLPEKIAPEWIFSRPVLRTKEYFMASVVGYLIPPVMLGYITAFYLIGNQFGVWSPAAVDYTDMASTAMPWLFPLSIGLQASILEEFLFRLVAICFLKRFIKSNFLAILIPAILWGFLHSNYPQQPFFIRGLELTMVGVLFGYVFLRFGIISTLIAHYTYDALLLSLFLFQSSRLYFQVSGVVVVGLLLVPLLPALIAHFRKRLEYHPSMLNAAVTEQIGIASPPLVPTVLEPPPMVEPAPGPTVVPTFLTAPVISLIALACLLSIGVITMLPVERFLDFMDVPLSRQQVTEVADNHLETRGVDTSTFIRTVTFRTAVSQANLSNKYIREKTDLTRLNEIYQTRLDPGSWRIRYFKSLEKEEYRLRVSHDGRVIAYDHRIAEEMPGDTLTDGTARLLAEKALLDQGVNVASYRLAESDQIRRDARIDHSFVWEDSLQKIGEGTFRIQAEVQGNEMVRGRSFFKPPEVWVREEGETTTRDIIAWVFNILIIGGFMALGLRIMILWIHTRQINWRFSLIAAGLYTLLNTLPMFNTPAELLAGYPTSISLTLYLIMTSAVGLVIGTLVLMVVGCILFGFMEAGYKELEKIDLTTRLRQIVRYETSTVRISWREAIILSYAACIILPGLNHLVEVGEQMVGLNSGRVARLLPSPAAYSPVLDTFLESVSGAMMISGIMVSGIYIVRHYFSSPLHIAIIVLAFIFIQGAGGAEGPIEALIRVLEWSVTAGLAGLAIRYFWRNNILAYGTTFFLLSVTGDAWAIIERSPNAYQTSALALCLLALLPVTVWGYLVYKNRQTPML